MCIIFCHPGFHSFMYWFHCAYAFAQYIFCPAQLSHSTVSAEDNRLFVFFFWYGPIFCGMLYVTTQSIYSITLLRVAVSARTFQREIMYWLCTWAHRYSSSPWSGAWWTPRMMVVASGCQRKDHANLLWAVSSWCRCKKKMHTRFGLPV